MYNWDIKKLKKAEKKLNHIPEGKTYPDMIYPLQWLIMCGWDKIDYDEALIKYTAGTLLEPQYWAFHLIYTNMLKILSRLESLTGMNKFNYNYYKILMEQYAGAGLVSSKQQQKIQDRVKKYQSQNELKNTSGLEIK